MERRDKTPIKSIEASTEIDVFPLDVALARHWYGNTTNTTGTLNILHCLDVANILKRHVKDSGIAPEHFKILYLASLGHDLFEDTAASRLEVGKQWGNEVVELIDALTNIEGDKHTAEYSENLAKAGEDVRLVKLADILSNVNNTLREYDQYSLKKKYWLIDTWIPMLNQYDTVLLPTPWKKYQDAAALLTQEIKEKIKLIKSIGELYEATIPHLKPE